MTSTQTKYLTPSEFARRAGVHINTVYNAISDGRLKFEKVVVGLSRWEYRIPETELPDRQAA